MNHPSLLDMTIKFSDFVIMSQSATIHGPDHHRTRHSGLVLLENSRPEVLSAKNLLITNTKSMVIADPERGIIGFSGYGNGDGWRERAFQPVTGIRKFSGTYALAGNSKSSSNYYHFLIQCFLPLLLFQSKFKALDCPPCLVARASSTQEYAMQYFNLLGEPCIENLPEDSMCIFSKGFYTDLSYGPFVFNPSMEVLELANDLVRRVWGAGQSRASRSIYITRDDSGKRQILNEDDVLSVVSDYGYEVVSLTGLSALEQIEIFSSSTKIISPHGAGLSNLIWCEHTEILELMQDSYINPCFWALSARKGNLHRAIISKSNRNLKAQEVDINLLKSILSE